MFLSVISIPNIVPLVPVIKNLGYKPDFEETLKAFEDTYSQYRNAFKELAK